MSKKQYCKECYGEITKAGECVECDDSPKKKHTISDKIKNADAKKLKDVEEWVEVPSPYKKYKEGV